jgi:DNA modification methylase
LAERVVERYSFQGDLVLDPFAGIGTVGIACLGLARRYYLIERKQKYLDEFHRWKRQLGHRKGRQRVSITRPTASPE